jgi:hypothetical protein
MKQICEVYRTADDRMDCTNGGISSRFARLLVISQDEAFGCGGMADERTPIGILTASHGTPVIRPHPDLLRGGRNAWTMFGGNFASTSDSRFLDAVEAVCGYRARAVPIHDREE